MPTIIVICVWLTLLAARGTPIGAQMHRWAVALPARRLSQINRGHILLMLVLIGIAAATVWLLDNEGRMLLAFGLPDIAGMAVAIDLGTLLDVTLAAVAVASVVRLRAVGIWLRGRATPRRARTRSIRVRRARPPANDDEDRAAWTTALVA